MTEKKIGGGIQGRIWFIEIMETCHHVAWETGSGPGVL